MITINLTDGSIIDLTINTSDIVASLAKDAALAAQVRAEEAESGAQQAESGAQTSEQNAANSAEEAKSYADSIFYDVDGGDSTVGTQIILDGGGAVRNG